VPRRILIGVAVAIAAVAGAVVFVVLRGNGSPVGRSRAVARHVALQGSDPATGLPAPGVYTYATSGWECAGVGSLCSTAPSPTARSWWSPAAAAT
jgi:hypothetical protein